MANLLDRFNKTVAGSDQKLGDYLSKIAPVGDFKRIGDLEVIISSWSNILITPRRSYQFDPNYGSNLYKLVFEPADPKTESRIIDETVNTIRKYDDRAVISNVSVVFLDNMKGFSIGIDVSYQGERGEFEVVIDESAYFKFLEVTEF